ncbi:aromatic acid/H+ symport family MFS transporter [Raineyella sp.]|uniref:MFS transporter n=1 Tax=Raineyella sp. TaxID=1911550 RepID=UPI002B20FD7E|nr:aromatic acid/H+ symport family MFS transporter [Raineyella sp.]MEA5153998.1 aromatic acid/H+ symport family MFS transporter [Raineyella sp.]
MTPLTQTSVDEHAGPRTSGAQVLTAALCWSSVILEGFDLVTLGAVIPALLGTEHLGFTPSSATLLATMSLVGVGVGASLVGPISDRLGRRVAVIGSVLLFSVFTLLQPLATSVAMFTILRFVAGVGLGAVQPVALTIMSEVTPPKHKAKATTVTMTGYHLGAVLASLFALASGHQWTLLFYVGGGLGLVLAVLQFFALPDSRPQHSGAEKLPLSALLSRPYRRASIGTWVGAFMGLLLVYGLLTWLPQIMKSAGYSLDSSLVMLFVMNVGAVVGLLLAGWIADTKGIRPSALVWFALSAVFLALLSIRFTHTLALNAVVFVTGVFVFSAMTLIYALVAHLYPSDIRGTAMGLTSGIGRLGSIAGPMVTGALVANGLGHPWGFWFFAVVAVLGLVALLTVPADPPAPLGHHAADRSTLDSSATPDDHGSNAAVDDRDNSLFTDDRPATGR